ncbi:MAG: ComEC family competence protein [Saprospiraceae bacterium]|nr:ComEC family competence protein [Saprospiraceae bacterium]
MNPHEVPCLRLLIPFVAGLGLANWLDAPVTSLQTVLFVWFALGVLLSLRAFSYRWRWLYGVYLHLLLLAFGYHHFIRHHELRQEHHFRAQLNTGRQWIGVVYEAPSQGKKVKVPVRIEALCLAGSDTLQTASGNMMLLLEPGPCADSLRYGNRILFQASPAPTEGPKNPEAFDYRRYLHYKNIHYQAFVKPDSLRLLASHQGWAAWETAYSARSRLLGILQRYFPETTEYAVACALLVGYTEDLSDELRTAYAETGSMHALAVSGTHIGMLYVGLMFLVGRLQLRGNGGRAIETGLILAAIWAFTLLTGATASVLRASVMFSVYLFGRLLWREASAWNVLAASALLLLLYNPYLLFDVGFQLSYSAVAGMVFFYPRFYKMFPPMSRWLDEPLKVLLVGVSAQLGTLPLTLYYFHQFPVYFWLSGWVVVLVGAVFLWGGALLVLLDALSDQLAQALGFLLNYMLWGMNKAIFWIQELPGAVVRDIWVPNWFLPLIFLGLAFGGAALATRRGKWLMGLAGVLILWGVQQSVATWQHQRQAQLVVYHVRNGRLVDIMDGEQLITISSQLNEKQENYAAQAYRTACGVRKGIRLSPSDSLEYEGRHLFVRGPYVQFHDIRLVFIDTLHPVPIVRTDVGILSQSARKAHIGGLFELAIFDATNSRSQSNRWQEACVRLDKPWYDIRQNGAWLLKHFHH